MKMNQRITSFLQVKRGSFFTVTGSHHHLYKKTGGPSPMKSKTNEPQCDSNHYDIYKRSLFFYAKSFTRFWTFVFTFIDLPLTSKIVFFKPPPPLNVK